MYSSIQEPMENALDELHSEPTPQSRYLTNIAKIFFTMNSYVISNKDRLSTCLFSISFVFPFFVVFAYSF